MKAMQYELAVIGGGPAGLAAAVAAAEAGVKKIVVVERDKELGGILQQCVHTGFGLHLFKEELTGPEFAQRFIDKIESLNIDVLAETMVLEVRPDRTVIAVNKSDGLLMLSAQALVLAMGCRERTRGAISIPGTRPAGIYTAGTAQRLVNREGYLPGIKIVILGSGDIGLIMARRLTLEGAKVEMVVELLPYCGGLTRNKVQCLDDFGIPLYLSHTVVEVIGRERVEAVAIARVDEEGKPVPASKQVVECDTLLLSVGLIPENELSRNAALSMDRVTGGPVVDNLMETANPGIFACGNVVHVHDLADYACEEAGRAGKAAAQFVTGKLGPAKCEVEVKAGEGVRYVVPQKLTLLDLQHAVKFYLRPAQPMAEAELVVKAKGQVLYKKGREDLKPSEMVEFSLSFKDKPSEAAELEEIDIALVEGGEEAGA